jgi:hypothetical protein
MAAIQLCFLRLSGFIFFDVIERQLRRYRTATLTAMVL